MTLPSREEIQRVILESARLPPPAEPAFQTVPLDSAPTLGGFAIESIEVGPRDLELAVRVRLADTSTWRVAVADLEPLEGEADDFAEQQFLSGLMNHDTVDLSTVNDGPLGWHRTTVGGTGNERTGTWFFHEVPRGDEETDATGSESISHLAAGARIVVHDTTDQYIIVPPMADL